MNVPMANTVDDQALNESYGISVSFTDSDENSYTGDDADNDDDTGDQYPTKQENLADFVHHCFRKSTEAGGVGM